MLRKVFCLMGLLVLVAVPALATNSPGETPIHVLKVSAPDKAAWVQLFTLGLDIPESMPGELVTVFGTDAEKEWLEARGYSVSYEIKHVQRFFATRAKAAGATTMGGYRTLSEVWTAIDSIVTGYPAIVSTKYNIGTTHEGRPIYAIRISDDPTTDQFTKPAVMFTAIHHAREVITPNIIIYTMQQLTQGYGTDTLLTRLIDERELWFVPIVNPDGYYHNEVIAPDGGGLWRKNRRDNGDGTWGVDLNRNYGKEWGYDNSGSSPSSGEATYRGPGPFSEPETQTLRDFCIGHPNIVIAFNYHSYSNLLLWPPGWTQFFTEDQALFQAIGDSATHWNGYNPVPGWRLYVTNGDSDDWMYYEQGILSFTPEVGSSADYFWPDLNRVEPLTLENYPANIFVIEIADDPRRVMPPEAPLWDSVALVGEDSLGLYWRTDDTTTNVPVSYDVIELFGAYEVVDLLEDSTSDARWDYQGFSREPFDAYTGLYSLYSGNGNSYAGHAVMAEPLQVEAGDTLRFWARWDIEEDWDYAYVMASTNGGQTWETVPGNITTTTNPHANNLGYGITGSSNDWEVGWFDLASYVGQETHLRFSYLTDGAVTGFGFYVDNISPVPVFDSSQVVATTPATSLVLDSHPDGDYYFRIMAEDAQGQRTQGSTTMFSYFTGPNYTIGDVDESGSISSADIVYLVNNIFKSGPDPLPEWQSGDVNASGSLTSGDIIYLVNFVFKGGPPPVIP